MKEFNKWYFNKQKEFTKKQHRIILILAFIGGIFLTSLAQYLVGNKGIIGMMGKFIPMAISVTFGSFSLQAIVNKNHKE